MEVLAKGKYVRVSPKKARAIADLVRGKKANDMIVMLKNMPQTAALHIQKVLKSAIANAENNFNLDKNELTISKITIDGGPTIKRYQPRAKGSASPIKKRTSHIEVVVSGDVKVKATKSPAKDSVKKEKTEEKATKIESERPIEKQNFGNTTKAAAPKMFRRKTG